MSTTAGSGSSPMQTGVATRAVDRDRQLSHQIVLFWHRLSKTGVPVIAVSCNCRVNPSNRNAYEPMGYPKGGDPHDLWRIYNNPINHNNFQVVFDKSWQRRPWEDRGRIENLPNC